VIQQSDVEHLLRELAPQVLGTLVRRHARFDACEDAVQEALIAAAAQWPEQGVPDNPRGWLVTVAARRLVDRLRADQARWRREMHLVGLLRPADVTAPAADEELVSERDDSLTLLFLCCHPALTSASQIALTLRSVGGLTTAEIAGAFFVPEATMAQRVSRAKQKIKDTGSRFSPPPPGERAERLAAVLHVLYLIFNEGYTTSSGERLLRADLTVEAIRLTRELRALLPDDGEVVGLLALMLLTEARRPARTRADGSLVPLAEQDRGRWDGRLVAEGVALIMDALSSRPLGPYQLQAAIAAIHDEAPSAEETDWRQILVLYGMLDQIAPNPMVTLNRAIAVAMVNGPRAGLTALEPLDADARLARHHRLHAVRAHLLEMAGDLEAAHNAYLAAARATTSLPERRYLQAKAAETGPRT
jgi:RNA polymerase sigma factor (sigma-70 family)